MRHSVSKTIALGLLSAYILHSSGKPIVPIAPCQGEVECRDPLRITNWPHLARTEAPSPAFDRRASGGGRPNKPDEHSPNAPQANPNDPNNPFSPGDQQGESGGFSEEQETSGGFSNSEETEGGINNNGDDTADPGSNTQPAAPDPNAQPANPNPAPNAPAANNPGQPNAVQYPPSARNNHNQPAVSADEIFRPKEKNNPQIDVAARRIEFQTTITSFNLNNRPWFFYSGLKDRTTAPQYKTALSKKLGRGKDDLSWMDDVMPITQDVKPGQKSYKEEHNKYKITQGSDRAEEYYWAVNSKAFARAVSGDVYVVLPAGRGVNQPYEDQPSNWWTHELPELTRNPNVNSVTVAPVENDPWNFSDDPAAYLHFGPDVTIWRQGDEPIGFPANELHFMTRPDEQWEKLPEVDIPDSD